MQYVVQPSGGVDFTLVCTAPVRRLAAAEFLSFHPSLLSFAKKSLCSDFALSVGLLWNIYWYCWSPSRSESSWLFQHRAVSSSIETYFLPENLHVIPRFVTAVLDKADYSKNIANHSPEYNQFPSRVIILA